MTSKSDIKAIVQTMLLFIRKETCVNCGSTQTNRTKRFGQIRVRVIGYFDTGPEQSPISHDKKTTGKFNYGVYLDLIERNVSFLWHNITQAITEIKRDV